MNTDKESHSSVQKLQGIFKELNGNIQQALEENNYFNPTPIQEQAIPHIINGKDMIGCAQTGTGKTAAFSLPLLHRLIENTISCKKTTRALILAPTRELAIQIGECIDRYSKYIDVNQALVFGGVSKAPQIKAIQAGAQIIVATPGRLLDLMDQKKVNLSKIEYLVLDEVDRMLDMGFLPDLRKILKEIPKERQSLFFTATLSSDVSKLARSMVYKPAQVTIEPDKPAVELIDQSVYFLEKKKKNLLVKELIQSKRMTKVLVFTQMKHVANKVATMLTEQGIRAEAIHSNKSQNARTRALENFKKSRIRVLVATDIAARGLHIDNVSHVINFDLPNEPEAYVHRIGRTARAGKSGEAHSFCSAEERNYLRMIEVLLKKPIKVVKDHLWHSEDAMNATGEDAKPGPKKKAVKKTGKRYARVKGYKGVERDSRFNKSGIAFHKGRNKKKP